MKKRLFAGLFGLLLAFSSPVNVLAENITGMAETELSNSAGELSEGAEELTEDAGELSEGAEELTEDAGELSEGAEELSGGTEELSEDTETELPEEKETEISEGTETDIFEESGTNLSEDTDKDGNENDEYQTITESDCTIENELFWEDCSDDLFICGAISPDYSEIITDVFINDENEQNDFEVVGAGSIYDLYDYLYAQLKSRASIINLSAYKDYIKNSNQATAQTNMRSVFTGVTNEHPELYYVEGTYSFYMNNENGYYYESAIIPLYNSKSYDDDLLNQEVDRALAVVEPGMTDEQKVIALHDYLVLNCKYDKERLDKGTLQSEHPDTYNMYGVLVDKIAVCQGYAETYKYLLNKCGIAAHIVTSTNINHAWNLVMLNGQYYQIDTTWDDPTWDSFGLSRHTYMLKSDNEFGHLKENAAKDWVIYADYQKADIVATSTKYDNAYWNGVSSPLVFHDGYYYYMKYEKSGLSASVYIARSSAIFNSNASIEKLYTGVGVWRSPSGGYWGSSFGGLYEIKGKLFFNTSTGIYSMSYDTLEVTEFVNLYKNDGNYVFGSLYRDGSIYYVLESDPNRKGWQTVSKYDIAKDRLQYKIQFCSNDGTNRTINGTLNCGVSYTIKNITFEREGYKLVSWNTKEDGSGTGYALDASVCDVLPADGSMKLYAQWEVIEYAAKFMGTSVTYDGSLSITYKLELSSQLKEDSGAYVLIDGETKVYLNQLETVTENNVLYHKLIMRIAVQQITDKYNISVYTSNNTICILRNNKEVAYDNNTFTYSAATYLINISKNVDGVYSASSVAYSKALLNYGYCADSYFDNSEIVQIDSVNAVSKSDLLKYKKQISGDINGFHYIGSSLILENNTRLRHYFVVDDGVSVDSLRFTIAKGNGAETSVSLTEANGYYYYETGVNWSGYFSNMYTFSARDLNGNSMKINYGIYSYIYDALDSNHNDRLANLVKALYLYGEVYNSLNG